MKNITYTQRNGIYYPDLELPEHTNYTLGKYSNLHLDFMKMHRRGRCTTLFAEGRLNEYLHTIDIQEDSRTNSKEMKELLGYMSRHHEDLEKSFTDEQKEIFEKFHDFWGEYMSLGEASIFEYAFKLGMQIAIETLTE